MDRHELNRMFDGLVPAPKRERELLEKLLQNNVRRKRLMKSWKQVVIAAAAAALLVTTATAAVVPGWSSRLLEYLGIAPENTKVVEALVPGTMEVDITKESNGATLHVTQVLWDRTSVRVLADFTAPEGTVLDMGDFDDPACWTPRGFMSKEWAWPYFIDEAGEQINEKAYGSYRWEVLKDGDQKDNRCSLMFRLSTHLGETLMENAAAMWIPASDLYYNIGGEQDRETVYTGDWSFEVPVPQKDIGYIWEAGQVIGELDGADITLESVYLSPLTLEVIVSREGGAEDLWAEGMDDVRMRWFTCLLGDAALTTKDGTDADLWNGDGGGLENGEQVLRYHLMDATAPAEFQGGILTLDLSCGKVTLPLDKLVPVEP